MLALTVRPRQPGSARLETLPDPRPDDRLALVQTLDVGICGTDREILEGIYGEPPPGDEYLILGHELLGRVRQAPASSGLESGDLVAGIVRHPDPVPCVNCAAGQWDMCRNGQYTEHGIKQLHGFCAEQLLLDPQFLVRVPASLERVGVLVEPASVLAKAWEHIERIGQRVRWEPRRVLVTGAGPIGLLGAWMGVQRGLEVHVLDRATEGPKPDLVRDLGAVYHASDVELACSGADIVLECTGSAQLVFDVMQCTAPNGVVCLTGISSGGRSLGVDIQALNRSLVLENDVVFGSVNANRQHYLAAVQSLAEADVAWLERLITRREPLQRWEDAIRRRPDDVKTVIEFAT